MPPADPFSSKAHAYLAAIIDSSDDAIVSKDLNSIITSWNRSAERMFGYSAEEAIGQPITLIIPQDLIDEEYTIIAKIKSGEKVDHFETVRRSKAGRLINVSLTVSPIRDDAGQIVGASKIARNVTQQMRTEAQLRLATEAAEIGLWDVDMVTDRLFWDARCKAMFGISPDVPVSMKDFYAGLHSEDLEATSRAFVAATDPAARAFYDVEYRTVGKEDGLVRWVAAKGRGLFDNSGRCVRVLGTTIDITERKQAETRLRELNTHLERLVAERTAELNRVWQYSRDMFVVLDSAGLVCSVSPAIDAILGRRPADCVNRPIQALVWPEDAEAARDALTAALSEQNQTGFEVRLVHTDGTPRWISWRTAREGDLVYAYGRDITAEKEQALALRQAEAALRQAQKMEAVGQLTGGIAHDFNNMLAVVMGSLDLLNRRIGAEDVRAKHHIEAAIEGAKRAASLTQRLLAFSRQQPLRPETLDINRLVAGMSDLLRHSIGADIRLETVLGGGLWPAHVDPNQLESVILNLGVNSRDAMPGGGRLTIETQNAYLDSRYSTAHLGVPPGQYVLIAISDTGTGMTPEVAAKAFDPFFTTKDVGKGTGLGLSQVYGFVKQSGGHIKIYSEVGLGTTVKIYLPRAVAAGEAAVAGAGVEVAAPMGEQAETILVVDDEPAVRQFSVDALTELGYRVLDAENAVVAINLLQDHPEVSLLFTDIVMPDTNGRKLADQAREIRPDLKVLYTTGYTRNAVVHNGVVDQGVHLIGKPFTIDELALRVRQLLDS
ncbi:MAG: PAS domain S-box protein [Asticcacaulis sp.]